MEVMNKEFYEVKIDNNLIAQYMPLQFALILTKAIYTEFYAESNLSVTIAKMQFAADLETEEVKENE